MHASHDFAPLDRVVAKYQRDVHHLSGGAPDEALTALEGHLGRALPPDLRAFLGRHNGANLFRGTLRIRSTSEVALASERAPQVVLFADAPDGKRWGWAADGNGGYVFGPWLDDVLKPAHGSFTTWFASEIALLDSRVTTARDQAALRFEASPGDYWQLLAAADRALRHGRSEEAESYLREVLETQPTSAPAWQLLGDALSISDRSAARRAWMQAFKHTQLPLAWPGAPHIEPEVLRSLRLAYDDPERWEKALSDFLEDQVRDVRTASETAVVVAAVRELARACLSRGRRAEARNTYAALLARTKLFTWQGTPWAVLLELAMLETDLGNHDAAESLLRRLRRGGPDALQGRGHLLLAKIATTRQEPWAEEIMEEAFAAGLSDSDQVRLACLHVERALRQQHLQAAQAWLDRARTVVAKVPQQVLQALVTLHEADVSRIEGRAEDARIQYERALSLLDKRDDPELRHRIHLRLGDLELAVDHVDRAESYYLTAAQGFQQHELPVREGWALLRLARVSPRPQPLLGAARKRFTEANLAAGLAALDAAAGAPGASLPVHLEQSRVHARDRHNAQQSRPPLTRADADRPERRLGAHRLAIAACSVDVVHAITRELDAQARAMSGGRARALDPPVIKYIAGVDLLSAHRSYEAASALLRHLLGRSAEGPARRALQGAIARSPNAALVDGLLSVVEHPTENPAPAVAEAAELLGLRGEGAAVPALVKVLDPSASPTARKAAVVALGRIGDRRVVDRLLPCLQEKPLAEHTALSLLMLGDRRGVDFHGQALSEDRRDLSGSPGEIVGRYGGPSYLLLLINAANGSEPSALGALQGLGLMGDPRAVTNLLQSLGHRDLQVVEVASGALEILTGHTEDVEDPGYRARWNQWWEGHRDQFTAGLRYRAGKLFTPGLLLERMQHDDAWVRRTAYDELVITTGVSLAFDSDGPWRVQRNHLRAWQEWCASEQHNYTPGRWYVDGKLLA